MAKHIDSTIRIVDKKPMKQYVMSKPAIDVLLEDPSLEEIMINKPDAPVLIYHREFGVCETNLKLNLKTMMKYIQDLAKERGEKLNASHPFLDTRIFDGSRINITIPPATPEGPTITIRRFNKNPFSIIELVKNGTMNSEVAAFLWTAVEGEKNYPFNILIIGGTGSGKTTTLTTLSSFMPSSDRIITIEDPIEINLSKRKNVIRMENHPNKTNKEMNVNSLLENALRMRPDRLIVGEVRGAEAKTLFNAMNVGHSAMGTMHANSPQDCVSRLTGKPMEVPNNMLHLMDLIVVQQNVQSKNETKRRITEVVEVQRGEGRVSFGELFVYSPKHDEARKTSVPSHKIETLASLSGKSIKEINARMKEKQKIIERLLKNNVFEFAKVEAVLQQYYEDANIIFDEL